MSRPDISAVAPGGALEMEMFSVVPRVTDAQPRHGITVAAANASLIIGIFPLPVQIFTQPQHESKRMLASTLGILNGAPPRAELRRERKALLPAVTF